MAKAKKLPSGNWRVQVFIGKDANGKYEYAIILPDIFLEKPSDH